VFVLMESAPIGIDGFAYIAVRRGGRLAAVLPVFWLCGFPLDDVAGSGAQRLARRVRRAWPGFARVSVLVCGHPLAEGRLLGDRLSVDASVGVLAELRALADRRRLPWMLFKDVDGPSLVERLPAVGQPPFFSVAALPDAIVDLPRDFESYLAQLKPQARRNARSKLRRAAADPDLRVEVIGDWRPLIAEFLPLYEAVVEHAEVRLTSLSPAFFEGLWHAPVQAALITCRQRDRMIVGLVCVSSSERCVSFRIGLDYEVVRAHNVWFVLQYEAVRLAIKRGCRQLTLLQSTYPAKLELGAHLDAPVHHLAHGSAPISAALGPAARADTARWRRRRAPRHRKVNRGWCDSLCRPRSRQGFRTIMIVMCNRPANRAVFDGSCGDLTSDRRRGVAGARVVPTWSDGQPLGCEPPDSGVRRLDGQGSSACCVG
jgi:Acetyltransferase (GNAT) domain